MRLNYGDDDKVEVQISPLIDRVFLLPTFLLATAVVKKWEIQIPLTLPTMTSGLSITRIGKEAMIIAVGGKRNVYQAAGHDAYSGENIYLPIKDLSAFFSELCNSWGVETNTSVVAYRTVPVSTVVEIFDQCQIQGFTHIRVCPRGKPYQTHETTIIQ